MTIEIARTALHRVRIDSSAPGPLADGKARVQIDRFALTTNNITYAVFGDALRYWEFFPPAAGSAPEWGRVPVWGFGDVVETRSPHLAVGERLYGYYPMSSELVIIPGRPDDRGVSDLSPHRAEMARAYSRYARCATDPLYRSEREDHQMVLYPLFFTSFLIDDLLMDNDGFGADQIVVSSASSKTAIGVAHLAHQRGARVVGLTSCTNRAFTEGLGVYDEVHTYEALAELAVRPSVYIDIAGNRDVLHAVHVRLRDSLGYSMTVGGTHWDHQAIASHGELDGPPPVFFFAPDQIAKRTKEWGAQELDRRLVAAWDRYTEWVDGWIEFRHALGAEAVTSVYLELLAGHPDPRAGFTCSLLG